MNDLQTRLLDMLKWLTCFLEKNNLTYYVIDGTMLGAARHHGFIPWDDDLDIAMPRQDYEKLIALFENPISHYLLEHPRNSDKEYLYTMAKLYDTNTTMTEAIKKKITRGIYIDIFPLDGIGNTISDAKKNFKKIDRLNMLLATKTCRIRRRRKLWKNIMILFGYLLPVNPKKLCIKIDFLCSRHDYNSSNIVGNLISTYRKKELLKKDLYGKPTKYEFENTYVYGPQYFDEYLTALYGNWKQLPPPEKRVSVHDFEDMDLEKPYLK